MGSNEKSAFWHGGPLSVDKTSFPRSRSRSGSRRAFAFRRILSRASRRPSSRADPPRPRWWVGATLPGAWAGREAVVVPFLKGPEGRREAADGRKENGELPPGRAGARGPGQPAGLSCLPEPGSAGSARGGSAAASAPAAGACPQPET